MDPQKLFFLDKKVVRDDRITSLIFSAIIPILLILIYLGIIKTYSLSLPILWANVATFVVLGLMQYFWEPYIQKKIFLYNAIYAIAGASISIFIIGFLNPLVFLPWLMLIITTSVYFKSDRVWLATYGIFVFSVVVWVVKEHAVLHAGDIISATVPAAFVGLISYYVSSIWKLFNKNLEKLSNSQANEKLTAERLGSLINSLADGMVATDTEGNIVTYNGAALNLLDLNTSLIGKTLGKLAKFVGADDKAVDIDQYIRAIKIQTVNRDFKIKYDDGSLANLYLSISPVRLNFGQKGTQGFVILLRDITREKSLEEERDEFISVTSHELRTPIAIAEGNLGNLLYLVKNNKNDKTALEKDLNEAHNQVLFLADLINDLSTLSRAEHGTLKVETEDIDVGALLSSLAGSYSEQAKAKGLKIAVRPGGEGLHLTSGQLYVREILQNFITNAIKYTDKGSVTLGAVASEKGVRFEVEDTGIGISKGDQERVFDKFFRSEDWRTRKANGTGLGLYVTLKLARLIGADIRLKSELNRGSTFSISIPNLAKAPE